MLQKVFNHFWYLKLLNWKKKSNKKLVFKCYKIDNIYMLSLSDVSKIRTKCLVTQSEDFWLWHGRLSHVHFELIKIIVSKEIIINLPKINFNKKSYVIFIVLAKNTKRLTSTMQVREILKWLAKCLKCLSFFGLSFLLFHVLYIGP